MTDAFILTIAIVGILVSVAAVYFDGKASAEARTGSGAIDRFETLRWAVNLASSNDPQQAELGIRTLSLLAESAATAQELQQVDDALSAVLDGPSMDLDNIALREEDYPNVTFVTSWGGSRGNNRQPDEDDGFDLPSTPVARRHQERD